MSEDAKDRMPPFKSDVIDTEFTYISDSNKVKSLQDDPEKIVRFERLSFESRRSDKLGQQDIDRFNLSKNLFYELRDKYGIAIPSIETIIGYNPKGEMSGIIITDRIHGKNLGDTDFNDNSKEQVENKFGKFFNNMAKYYIDKYEHGGLFLYDINSMQFVYGRKQNESEDNIYYVDVEPKYGEVDLRKPRNQKFFFDTLEMFMYVVEGIERKIRSKFTENIRFKFPPVRQKVLSFLDEISPIIEDPHVADSLVDLKEYIR